jgi:hypothetical protein
MPQNTDHISSKATATKKEMLHSTVQPLQLNPVDVGQPAEMVQKQSMCQSKMRLKHNFKIFSQKKKVTPQGPGLFF